MKDNVLCFLHQPKTGGQTLKYILSRGYHWKRIWEVNDVTPTTIQASINDLRALPAEKRDQFDAVSGHMAYGIHRFFSRPFTYITMLREPVDRAISHYYHIYAHPRNWGQEDIVQKKASIEDYVKWTDDYGFSNLQTRCLIDPPLETWDNIVGPHKPLDSSALELAKESLRNNFRMIGISERYDESVLTMKKVLGWGNILYGKINVTRGKKPREEISQKTQDLIAEKNWMDTEIWKYGNELLDQQIAAYGPDFERDLARYKKWNSHYTPVWKLTRKLEHYRYKVRIRTRLGHLIKGNVGEAFSPQ